MASLPCRVSFLPCQARGQGRDISGRGSGVSRRGAIPIHTPIATGLPLQPLPFGDCPIFSSSSIHCLFGDCLVFSGAYNHCFLEIVQYFPMPATTAFWGLLGILNPMTFGDYPVFSSACSWPCASMSIGDS